jgi:hypothetical protein
MRSFIMVQVLLIAAIGPFASAEIINVPEDFETIQAGINEAEEGDTVLVQPGIYEENLTIDHSLVLGSLTLTTGDPAYADSTVIDGGGRNRVFAIAGARLELNGITVCNGQAQGAGDGGGIFTTNTTLALRHVKLMENSTPSGHGGALATDRESSLTMEECVILGNEAAGDGGALNTFGDATLSNVLIAQNQSAGYGAADFQGNGVIIMDHVTIVDNQSGSYAAFYLFVTDGSSITNSIVYGNTSQNQHPIRLDAVENVLYPMSFTDLEGGVDVIELNRVELIAQGLIDADPLFVNPDEDDYHLAANSPCIDAGDPEADPDPDGTRADMGAFYFHQRDIEVEPDALQFVNIQTGTADSLALNIRNVGLTPLTVTDVFVDPEASPFTAGWGDTLTLEPASEAELWIYFSPDEEAEYRAGLLVISDDFDEDTVRVALSGAALGIEPRDHRPPAEFAITSVSPNPFNATASIDYYLPFRSTVKYRLFDVNGKLVRQVEVGEMEAGRHSLKLSAGGLPSGLYLIRIDAVQRQIQDKILLLK